MDMEEIRTAIREFVLRHVRRHDLRGDEDIFATGYVNSMFAMQLVTFLETRFSVSVESDDLELDNFRSVDAMAELVARKLASASAA